MSVVMCSKGRFHPSKPELCLDSAPTASFAHVPNGVFPIQHATDLDETIKLKAWGADLTLAGVRGSEGLSWKMAEAD